MRNLIKAAALVGLLASIAAGAMALPGKNSVRNDDVANLKFIPIELINNWTGGPFGARTPAVAIDAQGVVHFRGAMAQSGAFEDEAFVLPISVRPNANVWVPVALDNATNGRILITPDGRVSVDPEGPASDAQGFTSLDGASYSKF